MFHHTCNTYDKKNVATTRKQTNILRIDLEKNVRTNFRVTEKKLVGLNTRKKEEGTGNYLLYSRSRYVYTHTYQQTNLSELK